MLSWMCAFHRTARHLPGTFLGADQANCTRIVGGPQFLQSWGSVNGWELNSISLEISLWSHYLNFNLWCFRLSLDQS